MSDKSMKNLYEKFCNGESIDDEQLDEGIRFFYSLTIKLSSLGPVFRLAQNESNRVLIRLQDYHDARNET